MLQSLRFALLGGAALLLGQAGVLAQEPKKAVDVTIAGQIVEGDAKDTGRQFPCKVHIIKLEKGKTYQIDMVSTDFDTYLRIEDSAGKQLAEDDDGGGMLNSRIKLVADKDDSFKVIATSFSGGEGAYTLTVKDVNAAAVGKLPPAKKGEEKKVEEPKKEPGKGADGIKLETPTDKKSVDIQAKLEDGDPIDPVQNFTAKNYLIELLEGNAYTIEMNSTDFDAFLRVVDAKGKELAQDDDSGGNLNSKIVFVPPAKGKYTIVATSFGGGLGNYQLVVKPAGDFGKAVKYDAEKVQDGTKAFYVAGKLAATDAKDAVQQNSPHQVTQVKLEKGKTYVVDLISGQMDCYLRIENDKKENLAEDDDGGEGLNSRLTFTPKDDGVFRLIATNLDGGAASYILAIREQK